MSQEADDVERAAEKVEALRERLSELESRFEADADELRDRLAVEGLRLEQKALRPRKSDISVDAVVLVWMPWKTEAGGVTATAEPLFD